jgi:hypothetical protein
MPYLFIPNCCPVWQGFCCFQVSAEVREIMWTSQVERDKAVIQGQLSLTTELRVKALYENL